MQMRWLIILLLLITSCQSGLIPCPSNKALRLKKSTAYRPHHSSHALMASAAQSEESARQQRAPKDNTKIVSHISVEEWDCPKPGEKRYMPKSVKENIRKNARKIRSDKESSEEGEKAVSDK